MKNCAAIAALTVLVGTSSLAQAQADFYRRATPPNIQEGGVAGAALLVGREYQGSNESRTRVLPNVEYQWGNGFFAGVLNGVGYNASTRPDMAYGIRITADFGRKERRSAALQGLGDIDPRPEVGAFLNYNLTSSLTLSSSVRYGSGNERKGLLIDWGGGWSTSLTPKLRFGTSLAATWSNSDYAKEYFGVSADQSVRSGYARYTIGSGLRDVRLGASLVYRIAPAWTVTGSITRSELVGDSKRSPIVRESGTTSALVALGYSF